MNDPDRLTVPEVLPMVRSYYAKPDNIAGGNLHIVLDDYNVDDGHVESCLSRALEQGDDDGVELAEILLLMSKTQRLKLANHPEKRVALLESKEGE